MTEAPRLRFRREQRLLHRSDFDRVFQKGRRVFARGIVLHWMASPAGCARLGLVTSRRFGNAVARNRARRLVREAFRLDQRTLPPLDLVVLPQPGAFPDGLDLVRAALREAVARARKAFNPPQASGGGP